jgi:hypothetical protein
VKVILTWFLRNEDIRMGNGWKGLSRLSPMASFGISEVGPC